MARPILASGLFLSVQLNRQEEGSKYELIAHQCRGAGSIPRVTIDSAIRNSVTVGQKV